MHALSITLNEGWLIVDDLLQTGETDDLESVARACSGAQIDGGGLDRQFLLVVDDFVAAFRFAFDCNAGRKRLNNLTRNIQYLFSHTALHPNLDFSYLF